MSTLSNYGHNDTAGCYANVNGIRIYYESYGEGEPLLLMHGALQSLSALSPQIAELSNYYRVIAVDTRGHGRSSADGTRLSYRLYARDMSALIRHLALDSVYILGWSDGAITGLILAMEYSSLVKKLAVMAANLFPGDTAIEAWSTEFVRKRLAQLRSKADKSTRDEFAIRVNECMLREPDIAPAELQAVSCPTLVMAGGEDVIKPAHTELIARHIPGAQLMIFPGISHMAPVEIPAQFNQTVLSFLQSR
ncbi:alpha/beta hydrolase [Chitinophaga pendula]|uniref:alpha/beta fold hydrolase n=1 Tax=Chitinophaga TaxID=79328 RepID=UPI000BAF53C6|nr:MULTISPECIES: alpha/beta hydrolase [Chitinophaga]ASZ10205.1 alpha/beta hydrolase [Chitinophaga sp. MD30]UCJ06835.1 alpha/beta hydrolase [Chitinophaga pendula]